MDNINFTAFDFETAYGQKYACQIGIVVVRKGVVVEEKSYLIKPPENKISKNCQQVHGINSSMTKEAPTFKELWPDIRHYFDKQVIVHHSDGFDMRILYQEFEYYDIEPSRTLSNVSTMSLFPYEYSRSLKNICEAYDIQMEQLHDALSDARCCANIFVKYLNGVDPDLNRLPLKKSSHLNTGYGSNIDLTFTPKKSALNDPNRSLDSDTKIQDLSIVTNKGTLFYDKKVVISGIFSRYPLRNDLGLLLKSFGADVNTSISGKTNYFIAGEDCGPKKMEKVFDLNDKGYNIEILDEKQLYKILDKINHG